MRNIKQLLELLRENVIDSNSYLYGLCSRLEIMVFNGILYKNEYKLLIKYLQHNAPRRKFHSIPTIRKTIGDYWWPKKEKQPRLDWLDKQITKL